jgi:dihydrofolate synthase/folylpolyglutamate synthase
MLRDKDIEGVVAELASRFSRWHVATLDGPRGARAEALAHAIAAAGVSAPVTQHASPLEAFAAARVDANEGDKIVVFGSFVTVGVVMAYLDRGREGGND